MTDKTETPQRAGHFPDTGEVSAAILFDSRDLSIVWHSEEFKTFLQPPYDVEGAIGLQYSVASPLGYGMRHRTMEKVAETGRAEYGVDRIFSVESGARLYHWAIHRPMPGFLLTLIRCASVGHQESCEPHRADSTGGPSPKPGTGSSDETG